MQKIDPPIVLANDICQQWQQCDGPERLSCWHTCLIDSVEMSAGLANKFCRGTFQARWCSSLLRIGACAASIVENGLCISSEMPICHCWSLSKTGGHTSGSSLRASWSCWASAGSQMSAKRADKASLSPEGKIIVYTTANTRQSCIFADERKNWFPFSETLMAHDCTLFESLRVITTRVTL